MTKPFEWDGNHLLVSRGGPMTYRMATTADLAAALLAAPAEARDSVLSSVLGLKIGDTCVMHATEAIAANNRAAAAEARVKELEAELADVRGLLAKFISEKP